MADERFSVRRFWNGAVTAVDATSSRSFARHTHDEYGIGTIVSGAQRSWSGRGGVEAVRGDMISVNPGEVHDGAPIGENRSWRMLYFSPEIVRDRLSDVSEGKRPDAELHEPVLRDAEAVGSFARLRNAIEVGSSIASLDEELLLLFSRMAPHAVAPGEGSPSVAHEIRSRIDDDPAAGHPLAELALLAGVSRFAVLRSFAKAFGLTPHAYVVQRRVERARDLIVNGLPLAHTAIAAGFADQSHLNRAFAARYGFTPGAFAAACGDV